ncbi:unnamed protein product [Vicia faba]|uniref:Peroxidase n=1 Tax=Vicia faba TaxID=3906 RepID=A0AAV0YZD2_VICFA|nr:unnamed protein product [Vicia faba]
MNPLRLIATALCCVAIVFGGLTFSSDAQLDPNFYGKTCPQLQSIVYQILSNVATKDPRMPASLIRLHFHDCFVQGCDASVLLNKTSTIVTEQDALPNINSLRGLDVINQIKTAIEKACPNTVSCADILTLSAGISSVLTGGPGPSFTLTQLKSAFADQGLTTLDLVSLSGAHTFGRSRCFLFSDRLYNFSNTGKPDPTLDATYLKVLQKQCPQNGPGDTRVNFDPTTPDILDKNYYNNLQVKKGLLQSDQELFSTPGADTIGIVNNFANNQNAFFQNFANSMIRMGNIGVLTGKKGEIRTQCNFVNKKKKSPELDITGVTSTESIEGGVVSSI